MDKHILLKQVLRELDGELRGQREANEKAASAATHSEAQAKSKWDTCGLEQSYLARGHAMQYEALAKQVEALRNFRIPDYNDQPIGVGAIVELEQGEESGCYFVLNCGGGIELALDEEVITVITIQSPVGQALRDKKAGESFSFREDAVGTIKSVR